MCVELQRHRLADVRDDERIDWKHLFDGLDEYRDQVQWLRGFAIGDLVLSSVEFRRTPVTPCDQQENGERSRDCCEPLHLPASDSLFLQAEQQVEPVPTHDGDGEKEVKTPEAVKIGAVAEDYDPQSCGDERTQRPAGKPL